VEAPSRFKEKRNGFVYLELSLDDIPSQDIREVRSAPLRRIVGALRLLTSRLQAVTRSLQFLDKALANPQHAVLVHCMAGMSRSASMVIAFVMKARRMPYDTALRFVKERRPICMPNPGFHKQVSGGGDYLFSAPPAAPTSARSSSNLVMTHAQLLMMSEELCGIRVSEAEIKRVSSPMWF
jgi:hypothetical protein